MSAARAVGVLDNRRLAAVMFLDMAGFAAHMNKDEPRAMSHVKDLESILRSEVPRLRGRVVKFFGDGSMMEFPTALAAGLCAQKLHERIGMRNACLPKEERFLVRIGLHLGELVDEHGDIYGDAVNIAARIRPMADPGGISMTGTFYAQIKNHLKLRGLRTQPVKLKHIPERMSLFLVPAQETSLPAMWVAQRGKALFLSVITLLLCVTLAVAWFVWK
ncbi:MAG: adenylate/guanylate cyclase domain-containing protein [Elusimicrobiota bacterium]